MQLLFEQSNRIAHNAVFLLSRRRSVAQEVPDETP
jgi:hypothetical protein